MDAGNTKTAERGEKIIGKERYRKYGNEETLKLLSNVKLGTDLGILREMTDLKVLKMYIYSKPANLQKYLGKQYDAIERDIKRAEVIKQIINSN